MKQMKKVIDERQAQIAQRSLGWAFWGVTAVLLISLVVKSFFLGLPFTAYVTEMAALLVGAVVDVALDLRGGVYDQYTKPGIRSYLFYSLATALLFTLAVTGGALWRGTPTGLALAVFTCANFLMIFVVCYGAMALYGAMAKKRQEKLDHAFDIEDGEE